MPINREISAFVHGVENMVRDELINQDGASDAKNWISQDAKLQLIPGKLLIGSAGVAGSITGEIFGYKSDGTKVHYAKKGSKIQYVNGSTWTDVITGLTASADYSFTNYSSLAGTFTFAVGIDGIFKMHNANPGSYIALYDSAKNFKGKAFIDKGAMWLWDNPLGKTTLYRSKIDAQKVGTSFQYTVVTAEVLGSGDGANKVFTGTLAFKASGATRNAFSFQPYGQLTATKTITAITQALKGQITAAGHGYIAGDRILIEAVVGMTQLNGQFVTVDSVVDANNFLITTNTLGYTAYSSAGTAKKVELFTDTLLGTLTSQLGGTGTINYVTGAYSLTFNTAPLNSASDVLSNYIWEDSNINGVTDFTFSATRIAAEGILIKQDEGGDAILNVLIGSNGYYSIKSQSAYRLTVDTTDLVFTNNVYRKQLGIPSWRAAISTGQGIVFINTANPEKPEMTILTPNLAGDSLVPKVLFPSFKFANYLYDDCTIDTYDRYVIVACKTPTAANNDTLLLCNITAGTVDITGYAGRTFAGDGGLLYMGSSVTQSVYNLFSGFDDDGFAIDNFWKGKGENFAVKSRSLKYAPFGQSLKKYRKMRLKGSISPDQSYAVYISYDDSGYQLVGTVLGSGSYVDYQSPQSIGSNFIGSVQIGGDVLTNIYPYFVELRIKKMPKFRKRNVKFVALGIGYVSIEYQMDWDLTLYESKIPGRFRQKQNVSLNGATTNNANPAF